MRSPRCHELFLSSACAALLGAAIACGGSTPPASEAAAEGKCTSGPRSSAQDIDACTNECQKLADVAPAGSKCATPRAACMNECNTKFKK